MIKAAPSKKLIPSKNPVKRKPPVKPYMPSRKMIWYRQFLLLRCHLNQDIDLFRLKCNRHYFVIFSDFRL